MLLSALARSMHYFPYAISVNLMKASVHEMIRRVAHSHEASWGKSAGPTARMTLIN